MLLKEKLKNNTVVYKGWYINENNICDKFIKAENCVGANSYYFDNDNVKLIINAQLENESSSPSYTAIINYRDGSHQSAQFDGLKTVEDLNIAILEVKRLHKSSYWSH